MQFDFKTTPQRTIYNLINGLVAPRPIALVISQSADGRLNAAPFSSYNYLCINPPILGLGISARPNGDPNPKDTARNILETKEYVVNVVTEDIAEKMNLCGVDFPSDVNELEMAGLTTSPSLVVKPPRIQEAHAAFECQLDEVLTPGNAGSRIVLGSVVAAYVEDQFIDPQGPYVLAEELHSIGRMNGLSKYVHTRDAFFEVKRMNYSQWRQNHSQP